MHDRYGPGSSAPPSQGDPLPELTALVERLKMQYANENSRELALAIQRLEEAQHWLWQKAAMQLAASPGIPTLVRPVDR